MSFFAELKRRNVLRVAVAYLVLSWLLVQVASVLLPTFEAPPWVMRVMVLLLAAGFVATLVASWVYELTPEGLKRESEVDRGESITHRTARKLDIAVIVLLVAAIGVALLTRGGGPAPSPAPEPAAAQGGKAAIAPAPDSATAQVDRRPSVAVLPFVNMSALAENEYFADGLSETLLNMLAQVSGLKVAARTSAFAFKGSKTDIREIARVLNVNAVLEGSVQRAGTQVRITAQLIDARDGNHLWSRSYDRTFEDIFAIQDEIATAVAAELTRSLLGAAGTPAPEVVPLETHDAEAYDLYLRGLEQRNLNSYGSLPKAERLLKQALAKDPEFRDARIALARTYFMMGNTGLLGWPEAAERGRALLAPLLAGSSANPVALAYDAILQWRTADAASQATALRHAEETVARALEQAPNAVELYELAAVTSLEDRKKFEQGLEVIERGLTLDPLSPALVTSRGIQLQAMKRYDEALATYARLRELAPTDPTGYSRPAGLLSTRGSHAEAVLWCARAVAIDRDDHELPANCGQNLLTLGLADEARPWIKRAELLNASGSDTRRVLMQYAEQTKDLKGAMKLAADVIRERRDNRRGVYSVAVSTYLTLMHEAGKLDEALVLLESAAPGILDSPPKPPKSEFDLTAVAHANEFRAEKWSAQERAARTAHLVSVAQQLYPQAKFDAGLRGVRLSAMRGDTDRAAALLAGVLADPAERPLHWRILLRSPALAEAVKNPKVIATVAKLEADFAQQAKRYRELVATGEIVVP